MKTVLKKIDILDVNDKTLISSEKLRAVENRIFVFGDDFIVFDHGTKLKAIVYLEDGLIMATGIVTLSTEYQINIDIINYGNKNDRRKYLKVRTDFQTNLFKTYKHANERTGRLINEKIRIRDLSVGGICFYSNQLIFRKQHIMIDLYPVKRNIIVKATIIRREQIRDGSYKYRYGCRFVNLNSEQERAICEYVFRVQIENHKSQQSNPMV